MVVGFLPELLHSLRIQLLFDGFSVLHEEILRLLIVDPSHVFRDLVNHRPETVLLMFPLILFASCPLYHTRNFGLSFHASPVELFTVVGRFTFAALAQDISLVGGVVLPQRSTTVQVRGLHPLHGGRPQSGAGFDPVFHTQLFSFLLLHHLKLSTRHDVRR